MSKVQKFYITTAIAYVNAPPHIGFALELIFADVLARFYRQQDVEVRFLTGTDEHGQKILQKATDMGKEVHTFTDEISHTFHVLAKRFTISNTDFIRTTEERHREAAQDMWRRVRDAGYIYKKKYSGLYCVGCEAYKTEHELVDGKCIDHKTIPQFLEEENYFFKLSAFKTQLLDLYIAHPDFVVPSSKFNEVKSLLKDIDESFDVSISRSVEHLSWGIPVPDDASHVMYVWFDALVNYMTGVGFPHDADTFAKFWPADVHLIGKEINRFHSILWPAMLMAADLPLPKQIAVHGWIHVDGQKMSKSLGNVIQPDELIEVFGIDASRYLLLSQIPFTNDGDWNWERSKQKYSADLANNLGNLVHRVTSMSVKYFSGSLSRGEGDEVVDIKKFHEHIVQYKFDQALQLIFAAFTILNQQVDEKKPWTLAKEGRMKELEVCLGEWLSHISVLAELLKPFMPETAERILERVGGEKIIVGEPLFPRLEEHV